jgi:ribosomal protein S18 acetylase RimI-like enzyme
VIRRAAPADLPALLDLYTHLHPTDPPPDDAKAAETWGALLGSPLVHLLVAEGEGRLVAGCLLVLVPNLTRGARPFGVIENVVTHAAHRRQGHGRAVLAHALGIAWAAGSYKVMLATGSTREATLRFYEGAGFARGGKTYFEARRP